MGSSSVWDLSCMASGSLEWAACSSQASVSRRMLLFLEVNRITALLTGDTCFLLGRAGLHRQVENAQVSQCNSLAGRQIKPCCQHA